MTDEVTRDQRCFALVAFLDPDLAIRTRASQAALMAKLAEGALRRMAVARR
jgi:hypothetical protein